MPLKRQDATLSPRQIKALECLVSQGPDETYQSVADRAGIHRATLYRYMDDPLFFALYNQRIRNEFRMARLAVSQALIRNARTGDVQSQRLYYQLSGLLTETVEIAAEGKGQNIESMQTIDPDSLSPEAREILWKEVQKVRAAGQLPAGDGDSE